MKYLHAAHNTILALATLSYATFATAQTPEVDDLLAQLRDAEAGEAQRIGNEVLDRWARSGSPAMDHLLRRGRGAIEAGDYTAAMDHLTALTDHAPEFAEGWITRATAHFQAERYGMAMSDFERGLALNPNHFGALSAVGAIFERVDKPDAALRALNAALAIHPHLPQVAQAVERLGSKTTGTDL